MSKEKLEGLAEGMPESTRKMIADVAKSVLGEVRAEMLVESEKVATEQAQKALEGKFDEAAKQDAANDYQRKYVADLAAVAGALQPVAKTVDNGSMSLLTKTAQYLFNAGGNAQLAADAAVKSGDIGVTKALGVNALAQGGALVPGDFSEQVIEELVPSSTVLNTPVLRMPFSGVMTMPYEDVGPTANWVGENDNADSSDITFGQIQLTEKSLVVVVPASKRLLRAGRAAPVIERSMRRKAAATLDAALIRGAGTQNKPSGLRYLADSGNLLNVNGTVSAANTVEDLLRCQQALWDANVMIDTPNWLFAPRTMRYLMGLRDSSDGYVFRREMEAGTLFGAPFQMTTNIPTNLAVTDTDESEIYYYNAADLVFGVGEDFRMEMVDGAAYYDGSAVQAGFSRDQVVFKLLISCDFAARFRGKEIAALIDVDWT